MATTLVFAGILAAGCGPRERERARTLPLPVQVLADSSSRVRLNAAPPPEARIWMARVTDASAPRVAPALPAPPHGEGPPLPDAAIDTVVSPPEAPALEIAPDLEPPILKRSARLVVPDRWRARRGAPISVELDLLIEESGQVTQVEWAGGSVESLLVDAATQSAMQMRFLPALRRGHPVAVWSRQRFDFGAR
jgi:hypothetical protein